MSLISRITIAPLQYGYQERLGEQTLTTSDNGGLDPPAWANSVILDAAERFVAAWGESTGGSAGTVGQVYGPGTYVLSVVRGGTGNDGKLHLCSIAGAVSAYVSWGR